MTTTMTNRSTAWKLVTQMLADADQDNASDHSITSQYLDNNNNKGLFSLGKSANATASPQLPPTLTTQPPAPAYPTTLSSMLSTGKPTVSSNKNNKNNNSIVTKGNHNKSSERSRPSSSLTKNHGNIRHAPQIHIEEESLEVDYYNHSNHNYKHSTISMKSNRFWQRTTTNTTAAIPPIIKPTHPLYRERIFSSFDDSADFYSAPIVSADFEDDDDENDDVQSRMENGGDYDDIDDDDDDNNVDDLSDPTTGLPAIGSRRYDKEHRVRAAAAAAAAAVVVATATAAAPTIRPRVDPHKSQLAAAGTAAAACKLTTAEPDPESKTEPESIADESSSSSDNNNKNNSNNISKKGCCCCTRIKRNHQITNNPNQGESCVALCWLFVCGGIIVFIVVTIISFMYYMDHYK